MKVAAYCRVSTELDDQQNSLKNQKEYFASFIKKKEGENWQFAGIYADEGISGTSMNKREAFLQMMQDAKNGKIDLILTKEVSRFARNTVDTLIAIRTLKSYGVGVFFIIDHIDTRENDGEIRLTLMASMAQEESRKISERVKWGQKRQMEKGVVFGRSLLGSVKRKVKEVSPSEEKRHPVSKPISENPKRSPVVDLRKLRREYHRETADIKALLRTGRKDDAVIALEKLEVHLHHYNVHVFDSDLADIRKEYGLNDAVDVKTDYPVAPAKKTMSEAEKLLREGQFAEAKRKFASEGNSEMAQACSKLIRAKRSIASYVSGLDSVRRSRNVTSKQNAIKELENSLALYRQYGLVTKEIEQLIERYKSI